MMVAKAQSRCCLMILDQQEISGFIFFEPKDPYRGASRPHIEKAASNLRTIGCVTAPVDISTI